MSNQNDFVGRIRDNWRHRAGERTTFRAELRVIPRWLVWVMLGLYLAAVAVPFYLYLAEPGGIAGKTLPQVAFKLLGAFALVTVVALPVSAFVFLIGYIGADAKRRGMHPVLWELIALFVPYLIGAILYFVVREPLPLNCPQCGHRVSAQFSFCPGCQFNLRSNCPQCRRAIRPEDRFCPYCGLTLPSDVPASEGA